MINRWHKSDVENRIYVNLEGNKKASMPRYYKDKIYNDEERNKIKNAFAAKMEESDQKAFEEFNPTADYEKALAIKAAFDKVAYRLKTM